MKKEPIPGDARTDTMHSGPHRCTPEQEAVVVAAMLAHAGPENALPTPDLITETGVPGKPLRDALSKHDGVSFVLGKNGRGLFVARSPEEAEGFTRQLERHLATVAERIARRRRTP